MNNILFPIQTSSDYKSGYESHFVILSVNLISTSFTRFGMFYINNGNGGELNIKKSSDNKTIYFYGGQYSQNAFNTSGYQYHFLGY